MYRTKFQCCHFQFNAVSRGNHGWERYLHDHLLAIHHGHRQRLVEATFVLVDTGYRRQNGGKGGDYGAETFKVEHDVPPRQLMLFVDQKTPIGVVEEIIRGDWSA